MKKVFALFILMGIFISSSYGAMQDEVLMPEQAFKPSAKITKDKIQVDIKLGDKIYIYKDKLKLSIIQPKKVSLNSDISFPKPIKYHEFIVYLNDLKIDIPISLIKQKVGENVKNIKLKVQFQGCSKLGLCYSPMNKIFDLDIKDEKSEIENQSTKAASSGGVKWKLPQMASSEKQVKKIQKKSVQKSVSKESKIAQTLAKSSIWVILVTFFGFGLLLSLTPCIFPMIPILSSIIVSQSKENMNAKRGFFLSIIYVLSMSVAYTIAGVLAGLFGANIQIVLQNPWVIVGFSAIFVALAFSMFGYYELQLPSSFQAKISKTSDKAQGKGIWSVAIMGFLSALIVGPCVAAPLAGALVYIGQTGDALLGGLALFVMSLGMGMPLLLIGLGAGKFMPKPGGWMENVSKVFGVVMLGVAVYMLSRVIPAQITMLLWAMLLIGSSVYLGALEPIKEGTKGIAKMSKVIGLFLLIYGTILFIGAVLGNTNPLSPLENLKNTRYANSSSIPVSENDFIKIDNINQLEKVINSSTKPVIVDFSANWCVSCKELEHNTFNDPRVKSIFKNFTLVRADVTKNSKEDQELMKKYKVFGPPVMIFFDKNHNEMKDEKIVGYIEPDKFLEHIKRILR